MNPKSDDPVEELVAALKAAIGKLAIMENATRSSEVAEVHEQCRRGLSRFNAERGKGVWVPREPTPEMSQAAKQAMDGTRGGFVVDIAYRAMIAATNPEGKDE